MFKFNPENDVDNSERDYSRPEKVEIESHEIIEDYFDKDTQNTTGRPDVILVEIIDKDEQDREFFITEVKNSTNEKTIRRGIKETLEYLAFQREGSEFLNKPEVFGGEKSGLLVVQDMDESRDVQEIDDQNGPVRIVQASNLNDSIEDLISDNINI